MAILIYGMVFLGSALMVYNIITFVKYINRVIAQGYWNEKRFMLYFPLVLLIGFLLGYLVVGIFGKPDIIMSGILFFGSVYVTIILAVLQSITDRIQKSEQLESELRAAEESSRAKTRFLSNMSHEIRTPMNAIIGMNTLALRNPDLPEDTREQLEKIDESAKHMLGLINDILDMSRIESGRVELKNDPFTYRELVDQVNTIINGQCQDKGLTYTYQVEGPVEEGYVGDILKLKQVLINILGNAVKFTNEGGAVRLKVRAGVPEGRKRPMRFVIEDTGVGMDEEYLSRIFDAFTQEDDTSTNRYGGSGLGMSITRSLVELMDGTISVKSQKGRGSTFTVDIPLHTPDLVPEQEEARSDASREKAGQAPEELTVRISTRDISLEGRHLLVAEDIEINAEILMDLLEMEDITSDWAGNGRIAVDMFAQSEPFTYDAILMDLRMPEMDGLEATRRIRGTGRADAAEVPIIALTANAFEEDVKQCLDAGMNAHVPKPVDADYLTETLKKVIAEKRDRKEGQTQ